MEREKREKQRDREGEREDIQREVEDHCAVLQLFRVPESKLSNKASLWQHHNCYQSNDVILSTTRPL